MDILLFAQIVALEFGMISQVLLVTLLASAQGNLAPARSTYTRCLGNVMRADLKVKTEPAAFTAKLAESCKAEEAAFRSASVAVDVAAKISRATADKNATEEITYIRENTAETYMSYMDTNTSPR
jgi:hypothetical protein